ncbi:MAG: DNA-directed RNA polymerase subunit beta', partial [Patescibacteria group bacterium]
MGFEYSTVSGITWGMDDLITPKEKEAIMSEAEEELKEIDSHYKKGLLSQEEKRNKVIEVWQKAKLKIEKVVPQALPEKGPVFQIVDSGARGSWTQPVQMAGMKGLVINPAGQIIELPVKHSFKEGLDVLEYFISTHGARKGTADTSLRTSTAGYLTRRLIDVSHEIIIFEEDCQDEEGIDILRKDAEDIGQNFYFKITGRVVLEDVKGKEVGDKLKTIVKKGEIIDRKSADLIVKSGIERLRVRSALSCKSLRGVCQKCYGWDLGHNKLVKLGEAVGIVAAQAIGEPGTQLTMRTFHTGGIASGGDITFGLPRVQEVFEAREPKGKAIISHFDGKVVEITQERVIKIDSKISQKDSKKKTKKEKDQILEYQAPPEMAILVQ